MGEDEPLVSGAAVNTRPLSFGPDGAGDGRFFCTASGECTPDVEPGSFQGYDENGLCRSLNGRLTGVQKVCVNIFNYVFEHRSEVNRIQYCEQLSAAGKRAWQGRAHVSPTITQNSDLD